MALKQIRHTQRGLTLVELMVVTAIIGIISGIVFANYNRFGGMVRLQNLAYDISLSMRQAQVYGVSGFTASTPDAVRLGMYFQTNANGTPATTYYFFADTVNKNGYYDGCPTAASCELVRATNIGANYGIIGLYVTPVGGAEQAVSNLHVSFMRPEPDAQIRFSGNASLHESARILLRSPRGDQKSVIVTSSGQIAVQ